MSRGKLLYLSRRDIEDVGVSMADIVDVVKRVFADKGRRKVEMPPKPGIHPRPDASIRAMLAYIPTMDVAGCKWISGYGRNYIAGLPNIAGLVILNDSETGRPRAVMDCTWITAKRTGAATAVSARCLARSESRSVGLVACGALARTNLEALRLEFPLEIVRAYDLKYERATQFAAEVGSESGIAVEPVRHLRQAVEDMDIVVTSGAIVRRPKPAIRPDWLKAGSFGCALDFDATFSSEAFAQANLLVTDDFPQFEYFRGTGHFRETPEPNADLGRIAAGLRQGRRTSHARTMAILMGVGVLDVAVGSLIEARARPMDIGTELPI